MPDYIADIAPNILPGNFIRLKVHPGQRLVKSVRRWFDTEEETKIFISLIQITFTFVALTLSVTSVFVSSGTVRRQLTFQQAQKQADMTYRFEERYEEMVVSKKGLLEKGEIGIDDYIYAYWGIQYDQYIMNSHNSFLPENFNMWMRYRYDDWTQNDSLKYSVKGVTRYMSYRQTFERTVKRFQDASFEKFYRDSVFKGKYCKNSK